MNATDILIRFVAQGAQQIADQIAGVTREAGEVGEAAAGAAGGVDELDQALDRVGDNDGLQAVENSADDAGKSIEGAGGHAVSLGDKLEGLRNKGLAIAAVGVGGLALLNSFVATGAEAASLDKRLTSLLSNQSRLGDMAAITDQIGAVRLEGHFEGTEEITAATLKLTRAQIATSDLITLLPTLGRAARTTGDDMDEMADTLTEAYKGLDLGGLEEMGLFFTDAQQAAVDAAKGISEAAGQAKFLEIYTREADVAFVSLGDSITGAQAASNDLHAAGALAMASIGAGAGDAQAHINGVLASMLNVVNASPSLEYAAGYLGYFGAGALTAVGGLMSVGSQIGLTILSLQSMGLTSVSAFTAMGASAWSAFTSMGTAALAAAPAVWAAMAPLLPLILAIGAAALVTVGALYLLSGAGAANKQAEADDAQANAADKEHYEKGVERLKQGRKSWIKEGETFEQMQKGMKRGDENSDDVGGSDPASQVSALTKQMGAIPTTTAAPQMPGATIPQMPPQMAPIATAPIQMPQIGGIAGGAMPATQIGAPVVLSGDGKTASPVVARAPASALFDARRHVDKPSPTVAKSQGKQSNATREIMEMVSGVFEGTRIGGDTITRNIKPRAEQEANGDIRVKFTVDDLLLPERGSLM